MNRHMCKAGRLVTAAVLSACGAASADPGRELAGVNRGWSYRFAAPQATIAADIEAGFRPISIVRIASNQYDIVYVQDSGAFANPNPAAIYNQTESTMNTVLTLTGRRLMDVDPYANGAEVNFAGIGIDNTGPEQRGWTWVFNRSIAGIQSHLSANPSLRPIDLNAYTFGGERRYSMVTVQNTGSEQRDFAVHFDKAASEMRTALGNRLTGQRLVSMTVHSEAARRVSGVAIQNDGTPWWFYTQLTPQQISERLGSTGSRLVSMERFDSFDGSGDLFAVVMINNSNALTTRAGEFMRDRVDSNRGTEAHVGLYFKEVGGPVLASLNADRPFEPASLIKAAHLVYAVSRFASGADSVAATLLNDDISNPDECPTTGSPPGASATETVNRVLRRMMERSDNNATREIQLRYGRTNINNYLRGPVGLTQSVINGTPLGCLDCDFQFNVLTPREICQLFERVADGSLFDNTWQEYFYSAMEDSRDATTLDDPDRFDGAYLTMRQLIADESAGLDLTAAELEDFTDRTYHVRKGGGYQIAGCPGQTAFFHAKSLAGWMRLPFKDTSDVITNREFVGATLIDFAPNDNTSSEALNAFPDLFRDQVRAALVSWDNACTPPSIINQPDALEVIRGGSAQFQVTAGFGVGPVAYQWLRNGVLISNGLQPDGSFVSGATTRTLNMSNVRSTAIVVARLTKACGVLNSSLVFLSVVTCPADFNDDGSLDPDDLSDFITCYFTTPPCAEADYSGDGNTDPDDLSDYITAYFAGC